MVPRSWATGVSLFRIRQSTRSITVNIPNAPATLSVSYTATNAAGSDSITVQFTRQEVTLPIRVWV